MQRIKSAKLEISKLELFKGKSPGVPYMESLHNTASLRNLNFAPIQQGC